MRRMMRIRSVPISEDDVKDSELRIAYLPLATIFIGIGVALWGGGLLSAMLPDTKIRSPALGRVGLLWS